MLIKYDIAGYQTLLFYGTGKVVRHIYVSLPNPTNRTCTGEVEQAEINKLLKALVKQRFFDMPLRRYAISSRSLDELRELKLHSIMIDDGTTRSSRQFAAGTYQGHQERIPKKFAAVEAALQNLGDAALAGADCNQASPSIVREIELPTIDSESASASDARQCIAMAAIPGSPILSLPGEAQGTQHYCCVYRARKASNHSSSFHDAVVESCLASTNLKALSGRYRRS